MSDCLARTENCPAEPYCYPGVCRQRKAMEFSFATEQAYEIQATDEFKPLAGGLIIIDEETELHERRVNRQEPVNHDARDR